MSTNTLALNRCRLWTALVTPMQQNGEIDTSALLALVREQSDCGNGLLILGSTGEALNIPLEQRKTVVQTVCESNPSVPVMVGVGGCDLDSTLSWIDFLETQPIDACLMVTPLYAKPGEEGQYQWFRTLMDRTSRPCMLYNIPGRSGVALHPSALSRLCVHPNFWSVKESGGTTESFVRYQQALTKGHLFCGDDAMMADYVPYGAVGLVSVASNAWPAETAAYVRLALANELNQRDIFLWQQCSQALFSASNPVPVKTLLAIEGRISSPQVRLPLHVSDLSSSDPLTNASQQVRNWFEKCRNSGRLERLERLEEELELAS